MEGLGRFTAMILMLLVLIWIPLEQIKKQQIKAAKGMAAEYIYEIDSLAERRGKFTKEEFERYSYILFLIQGLQDLEIQHVNAEIGRRK